MSKSLEESVKSILIAEATSTPDVKKAIAAVNQLDAEEFESFLKGMEDYFHEQFEEFDNIDFRKMRDGFEDLFKAWSKRSGN